MQADRGRESIAVFDIGGTWFRWGLFDPSRGLLETRRAAAISYVSHPHLDADDLQTALTDFIVAQTQALCESAAGCVRATSIALGAPINAHDLTVLGSGPLWGPGARPFRLHSRLSEAMPHMTWHLINDVSALLASYMDDGVACSKTMLITVSTGIGSRLYDHCAGRIPYDAIYGVQGEIGHLTCPFELDGRWIKRRCECGGWNHMNAFASGRGIAQTLRELPALSPRYAAMLADSSDRWDHASDAQRLTALRTRLDKNDEEAHELLDAFVTPLSRAIATALCLDPEVDRIVITGGVTRGFGKHYREAMQRTFVRDGLYQITHQDPYYLSRRLRWDDTDDFAGLRGAGAHAARMTEHTDGNRSRKIS